jgi:hypothetical protein
MSVVTEEPVVVEEPVVDEEKNRAELLKTVYKILEKPETPTKQADGDDVSAVEGTAPTDSETVVELSQSLKDRARDAGIFDELAESLHAGGMLEETLASLDRKAIDTTDKDEDPKEEPKTPAKKEVKVPDDSGESELDPDEFDSRLVKRDAFLQKQIAELKAQVAELSSVSSAATKQRDDVFQRWFTERVSAIDNATLFGKDEFAEGGPEHKNRQALCDGYERLCVASGIDPYSHSADMLRRAYPAMFPKEVFKAAQRETLRRLRDAEGKFLHQAKAGSPPVVERQPTEEESRAKLVKTVEGILKKKG